MERLKKILETENKKTFLDVGTGGGNYIALINHLYNGFDKMIGIDVIEPAIKAANERNEDKRIEFKVMDALNMDFEDNLFDVVAFSNTLHHVTDLNPVFKEMNRVLKNDGMLIVSEMIKNDLDKRQKSHMLLHHFAAKIDRLRGEIHDETFTESEIKDKLTTFNNFSIDDSFIMEIERSKVNTKEEIDHILNIMDRVVSRVPEEHKSEIEKEKEEIKSYILENGYDSCPTLVNILKKVN